MNSLSVGDWVRGPSKGYYRIDKIMPRYKQESDVGLDALNLAVGDLLPTRTVVLKRFLNSKFKKSFSWDTVGDELVHHLSESEIEKVESIYKSSESLKTSFEAFQVPPIESAVFFWVSFDNEGTEDIFRSKLIPFVESGRTYIEIKDEIKALGIEDNIVKQLPADAGLAVVNSNFESDENHQLIYRIVRIEKL